MPNPFPTYEKELKEFIEITPEIARRDFKWLCKGNNDKFEDISKYPLCGKDSNISHKEENIKRRSKKLAVISNRNRKRIIAKGDKEMPDEKEIEPKSTLDELWDRLDEEDNQKEVSDESACEIRS